MPLLVLALIATVWVGVPLADGNPPGVRVTEEFDMGETGNDFALYLRLFDAIGQPVYGYWGLTSRSGTMPVRASSSAPTTGAKVTVETGAVRSTTSRGSAWAR